MDGTTPSDEAPEPAESAPLAATPAGHPTASDIVVDGVTKSYPGQSRPAVNNVTMRIEGSMITVLIGPSGSGKTTILKVINRLVEPNAGRITIGGEDIRSFDQHKLRRSIGYVIQQIGLFPHWSIERNLATVPRLLGWDSKRIRARTGELLELVGLDFSVAKRYPSQLSGGQQQRVGVARALAADPPILLMDEPFAAVDPILREHLQDELLRIQSRVKKTIVFVTHDMDEAFKIGDRIAILDGEGHLHQVGSREDLLARPADEFVENFLGRERGLRQLAVVNLRDITLAGGPRIPASATVHEAREAMNRDRRQFAIVADGDLVLALVEEPELGEAANVGDIVARNKDTRIYANATLRETLDYLLRTRRVALPVFDGDEFLGVVTIDQIRDALP